MNSTVVLDPVRVTKIFFECFWEAGEDPSESLVVKGIKTEKAVFNRDRLKEHREEIIAMLDELSDEFGERMGGASFVEAYLDRHDRKWAAEYPPVEQLFLLGLAVGKVAPLPPRETWVLFPDGIPLLVIRS